MPENVIEEIFKVKREYNELVDRRIEGKIELEEFLEKERELNNLGIDLRRFIFAQTSGECVMCRECYSFFTVINNARKKGKRGTIRNQDYLYCYQHKNRTEA